MHGGDGTLKEGQSSRLCKQVFAVDQRLDFGTRCGYGAVRVTIPLMLGTIAAAYGRMKKRNWNFPVNREVGYLQDHLESKEQVLELASGTLDSKPGLLALTDGRLIFISADFSGREQVFLSMPRGDFVRAEVRGARLELRRRSATALQLSDIVPADAKRLAEALVPAST